MIKVLPSLEEGIQIVGFIKEVDSGLRADVDIE